jgi:hypothetical protein
VPEVTRSDAQQSSLPPDPHAAADALGAWQLGGWLTHDPAAQNLLVPEQAAPLTH